MREKYGVKDKSEMADNQQLEGTPGGGQTPENIELYAKTVSTIFCADVGKERSGLPAGFIDRLFSFEFGRPLLKEG